MPESTETELRAFVEHLTSEEKAFVRDLLRSGTPPLPAGGAILSTDELVAVETWFFERIAGAPSLRTRQARIRCWCIFILLRYAALRLQEIVSLSWEDLASTDISVPGRHARTVFLPQTISHRLRNLCGPERFSSVLRPFSRTATSLRHVLARCATDCSLPKGVLNARTIRASRSCELQRLGMPETLLRRFLGTDTTDASRPLPADMLTELRTYTQMETQLHTSARNVFQGRVSSVEPSGIMVRVRLRTTADLVITALITDQSCRRLGIRKGTLVTAGIKAPWVTVVPEGEENTDAENRFPGTVLTLRGDTVLTEITVRLDEGSTVCSLTSGPCSLREKDRVHVFFKSLAVVLNTDLR